VISQCKPVLEDDEIKSLQAKAAKNEKKQHKASTSKDAAGNENEDKDVPASTSMDVAKNDENEDKDVPASTSMDAAGNENEDKDVPASTSMDAAGNENEDKDVPASTSMDDFWNDGIVERMDHLMVGQVAQLDDPEADPMDLNEKMESFIQSAEFSDVLAREWDAPDVDMEAFAQGNDLRSQAASAPPAPDARAPDDSEIPAAMDHGEGKDKSTSWRCSHRSNAWAVRIESLIAILDFKNCVQPERGGNYCYIELTEESAGVLSLVEGMKKWKVGPTMTRGAKKAEKGKEVPKKVPEPRKKRPVKKTIKKTSSNNIPEIAAEVNAEITDASFSRSAQGCENIRTVLKEILTIDKRQFGPSPVFGEDGRCRVKFPGASNVTQDMFFKYGPEAIAARYRTKRKVSTFSKMVFQFLFEAKSKLAQDQPKRNPFLKLIQEVCDFINLKGYANQ